jgi:hypothetical protein
MDREHAIALAGDVGVNTDDNMRIEYNAPLHLHVDTQSINVELLHAHAWTPIELLGAHPQVLAVAALGWYKRDDVDRAIAGLVLAGLAETDEAVREVRLEQAFEWFVEQQNEGSPYQPNPMLMETLRADFLREVVGSYQDRD